jgi:ABC-2 type transport system ATP-binding protein
MTIIVSSHILAELDQYAKDLLIMKNGRIIEHAAVTKQSEDRRKVMIRCDGGEKRVAELVQKMDTMDTVSRVSRENALLCLDFSGKDTELSELLRSLVKEGVPVVEFFIKTEGMQEQYLKTMRT